MKIEVDDILSMFQNVRHRKHECHILNKKLEGMLQRKLIYSVILLNRSI